MFCDMKHKFLVRTCPKNTIQRFQNQSITIMKKAVSVGSLFLLFHIVLLHSVLYPQDISDDTICNATSNDDTQAAEYKSMNRAVCLNTRHLLKIFFSWHHNFQNDFSNQFSIQAIEFQIWVFDIGLDRVRISFHCCVHF